VASWLGPREHEYWRGLTHAHVRRGPPARLAARMAPSSGDTGSRSCCVPDEYPPLRAAVRRTGRFSRGGCSQRFVRQSEIKGFVGASSPRGKISLGALGRFADEATTPTRGDRICFAGKRREAITLRQSHRLEAAMSKSTSGSQSFGRLISRLNNAAEAHFRAKGMRRRGYVRA
jgi:hypothetical protein